jgi:CHAT domain-containing protein/tetratricopeptide (TPR) repeat protein
MTSMRRALMLVALLLLACTRDRTPLPARRERAEPPAPASVIDPVTLATSLGVPAESLRAAGEERYSRQSYDSAQIIWRVEVLRARFAGETAAEARAHMWLGLAAWRLGDYPGARREGETSLAMKRKLGLDAELSRSFNALGLLAWNEGRHADALESFDSAIAAAKRHNDTAGIARAAANVPLVLVELGDFDGARRGLDAALAAGRAANDERLQGNALANLAMLEIRLGSPSRALPLLARARARYAAIEYATGEANALGQLATAWSEMGSLQRALALADSALAIARAEGLQQEVASELEVIADLHEKAGSQRLALRRLSDADSLDAALGLSVERAMNQRRLAALLLELGEVSASVARAHQALAAHVASGANSEAVYDRLQLAQSLSRAGDSRSARAQADTAGRDAVRFANSSANRDAAAVSARLALDDREPRRALALLDIADRNATSSDWRLADLRAEAWLALGKLEEARRDGERSVSALARERSTLGVGPLRSAYLANRVAPFSRLVAIHLARGDTASAFRVAASLPGRGIAERLGGFGSEASAVASVADEERLLLRIAALERQVADVGVGTQAAEQVAALDRALGAARTAYEEQAAHGAPSADARLLGVAAVGLREVQSRLAGDEALLTFLVGPDRVDLFVVRASKVVARTIPVGDGALAGRIRVARELLERGEVSPQVLAALGELHDLLIGPGLASGALDGATRLRIVPHGSLNALPFAALWDRRTGRYLVESQVITYLPSVAALTVVRQAADATPTLGLVVFAPLPDSLPGSAREAREIGRLLPSARLRIGAASSEAAVRAALDQGRPIHIASHGLYNAQNPLFSRIAVGRELRDSGASDGFLELHEILGIRTRSPLVFLSGCETGLGVGDGPFGAGVEEGSLAQAFLVAGAENVVATLWRVGDSDAMRLAGTFYGWLASGNSPEDALARTQRDAIRTRSGGLSWSAYTVSGLPRANSPLVSVKPRRNP